MKRLPVAILMLGLLVALMGCGGGSTSGSGDQPTLAPEATADADAVSPRMTPEVALPPTWTPGPPPAVATPMIGISEGRPSPGEGASVGEIYTVQDGDTLSSIAEAHDIAIATLAAANGLEESDELETGRMIIIPREP